MPQKTFFHLVTLLFLLSIIPDLNWCPWMLTWQRRGRAEFCSYYRPSPPKIRQLTINTQTEAPWIWMEIQNIDKGCIIYQVICTEFASCGYEVGGEEGIYAEYLDCQSQNQKHSLVFYWQLYLPPPLFSSLVPQRFLACSSMRKEKTTLSLTFAC